jgi:hypothetical protein
MPEILKREKIKVVILTTDYKITGEIPTHEGYRGRLSDLMNEEKKFINVTDAEVKSRLDDKLIANIKFLCLNKNFIILIYPLE